MNKLIPALLSLLLTALSACGASSPPPPGAVCVKGTTMACLCGGGATGVQTCEGDGYGSCRCDGTPLCTAGSTQACTCSGGATGTQTCAGNAWGACQCAAKPTVRHGDICTEPQYDCGERTNLVCVVDNEGDTQGACRLSCTTFSDCLRSDDARGKFDTDCCKIKNGTRACGQRKYFPDGACS